MLVNDHRYGLIGTAEARSFTLKPLGPFPGWPSVAYNGSPADPDLLARTEAFEALSEPYEIAWWGETRFTLWPKEELSAAIARTGAFEASTAVVLSRLLSPSSSFIDAGANSGVYTAPAARWCKRVVAVEPSPRELGKLRHNIEINGLQNVDVIPAALGAAPSRAILRVAGGPSTGHNTLAPRFGYGVPLDEEVTVEVTTVDALDVPADVIKMDVEGAEVDLIKGAWRTIKAHRPALIIEVNPVVMAAYGSSVEALDDVLRQLHYRVHAIDEWTGDLLPLATLMGCDGDNIVALPPEKV